MNEDEKQVRSARTTSGGQSSSKPLVAKFLALLILLATTVSLLYATAWLVRGIFAWLGALNSDVAKAIMTATIAGFFSIAALALAKVYERRFAAVQELRIRKLAVYEEMLPNLFRAFNTAVDLKPIEKGDEFARVLGPMTPKLLVYGSDDVLNFLSRIRMETDQLEITRLQGELVLEIRKDLGHKNRELNWSKVTFLIPENS